MDGRGSGARMDACIYMAGSLPVHLKLPETLLISYSESHSVVSDFLRPMDYTVYGILQARILEWVAFPFSRGFSQPRDRTQVSCIAGRVFHKGMAQYKTESLNFEKNLIGCLAY